jgi:hypothetical protein
MFGDEPKTTIYAEFVNADSWPADVESGKKLLLGEYYEVSRISIGQSTTGIQLKDVSGPFNSVQFNFYDHNKDPIDIFAMPEFNHYLGMVDRLGDER